jgi:hypothetical protein
MKLSFVLFLAFFGLTAFADSAHPPTGPSGQPSKSVDKVVLHCGPFEIWNRTVSFENVDEGTHTNVTKRVWSKLRTTEQSKENEMRETADFKLLNASGTVGCELRSWQTKSLNAAGDMLAVVSTCGQFMPLVMIPTFIPEHLYYIFARDGQVLRKGLCKRAPVTPIK